MEHLEETQETLVIKTELNPARYTLIFKQIKQFSVEKREARYTGANL